MHRGIQLTSLVICLFLSQTLNAEPLRLAVAANFKSTLTTLVNLYQSETGTQKEIIEIIPGATGALTAQIVQGAPFHVLFAADVNRPATLEKQSRTRFRQTYAIGRLVFWMRDGVANEQALKQFSSDIAVANPRHAPYGLAATQALSALNTEARLIYGNNVAQAFTFVQTGNAKGGLVSLAQVLEQGVSADAYWIIDDTYHDPIEQQLVVMKNAPESANRFIEWLQQSQAKIAIREAGYTPGEKAIND